jgi:hypothetical protein
MAEKLHKKMGRPVRFEKPLPRTFMIDEASDDLVDEEALRQRCSRSDALVYLLQQAKRRLKRAE